MRIVLPSGTPAEIARPEGQPAMGLVIAPDLHGLRPLFDDLVARLAGEWDMAVCAVEPFPGRQLGTDVAARQAAMPQLDDDVHLRDLELAADELGIQRVGLIGFCMGGMFTLKAARSDRFAALVAFYGMVKVPEHWQSPTQGEPLDHLAAGHPDRVLAIVGDVDPYTPADDVDELEATGVTVVRYPDADHGFAHDPSRPSHRAADAADAFARARAWLLESAGA